MPMLYSTDLLSVRAFIRIYYTVMMTSKYSINEFLLSRSLVCGDVCGKFNILYGRVRNILKKNKDFEVKLDQCILLL